MKIKIERPGRRGGAGDLQQVPHPDPAVACRRISPNSIDDPRRLRAGHDRPHGRAGCTEESEENQFLEVTYAGGDKEVLYFKDFNSGAMIQNIVDRAKKMAIKDFLDTGVRGLRIGHLLQACLDEFAENEDLPNTTNPDDWAKISGKKGERIVFIRTLDLLQAGHSARPVHRHRLEHRASTFRSQHRLASVGDQPVACR